MDLARLITMISENALTVGKSFLKAGRSGGTEFVIAACKMVIFIGTSAAWAFTLCGDPIYAVGSPWRLVVIMSWGIYMALIAWIMADMVVHMPNAPVALWEALFNVGWLWVGIPAVLIAHPVVYFGQVWMQITLSFLFAFLIAGVIAFWVWLRHTYSTTMSESGCARVQSLLSESADNHLCNGAEAVIGSAGNHGCAKV